MDSHWKSLNGQPQRGHVIFMRRNSFNSNSHAGEYNSKMVMMTVSPKEQYGRSILEKKSVSELLDSLRRLEQIGKGQGDMAKLARTVLAEKRLMGQI